MKIAFIEPHLKLFGGIRHVLEIGNELVRLGHDVSLYIPRGQSNRCAWMECLPEVRYLGDPEDGVLDAVIFNNEPDFAWLDLFPSARLTVYWLLHFALLYDKAFSWLSYRCPVDLYLAESRWIAQCLRREIGVRAVTINSGVNPRHFRPVTMPKTYEVLCYGDRERDWKGTGDIEAACQLLGVPLERYDGKGIPQDRMAEEYCRAKVFVHGSWYEGFGLPGLEALACGVPLITTDSGGPRDYAFHEETALVVPPRDPRAMADAIKRIESDPDLAAKLTRQGLELVARQFQWPDKARQLDQVLTRALEMQSDQNREAQRALDERPGSRSESASLAEHDGLSSMAPAYIAVEAPRSPGLGRALNAELRKATSDLVVIGEVDADAAARGMAALADAECMPALACLDGDELVELAPFSRAPPTRAWIAQRDVVVRAGGFGEGLQGYEGIEDFLLWNLWWHGHAVLGPATSATREPPRDPNLLRTFAALGAAHARFLYRVPTGNTPTQRPYGVEATWANGPKSVPVLHFQDALVGAEDRPLRELLEQLEQIRALPRELVALWKRLDPAVASLVRREREQRMERDELMRDVREAKQRNAETLMRLEQDYSEGQSQWNRLLARRELVRAGLADQAKQLRLAARATWNSAVLILGAILGVLLTMDGRWPTIGSQSTTLWLSAAASATLLHVAWRGVWSAIDAARDRELEGTG